MSEIVKQTALARDQLPSKNASDIVIVPATTAECVQTSLLNADAWSGPLSSLQYLEREKYLTTLDLTKNSGITIWILTSTSLPLSADGTRPILAACETILKTAYVARNGKVQVVRTHGIGSVYTRAEYRGKGYAGRMMTELGKQLESYQQVNGDKGSFSVLFSDIGQDYYANFGWKSFPSTHIELEPLKGDQYETLKSPQGTVQDLRSEDLKSLPATETLEDRLKAVSKQNPNVPCVAIRPDMEHFTWHHGREEISAKLMGLPRPEIKGAIHKVTGIAIVWNRVFATKPEDQSLHILNIIIPPAIREQPTEEAKNALSALLLRAQHAAAAEKMLKGVEVWDPSEFVIAAAQNLRTEEQGRLEIVHRQDEHINCLRWLGAQAGDDQDKGVIWVGTEKYQWS